MKRPFSIYKTELRLQLIVGFLFTALMLWGSAIFCGVATILFIVALYYIDQLYWFGQNSWVYTAMPTVQVLLLYVSSTLYKFVTEEREKSKVKGAFQHYLSPDVINQVLDDPSSLKLGGDRRELTVYFSDVRGFTTISESLSPEDLCSYMNEYFTPMTDAILKAGGTLDKYIGDAIMAFWGAPIALADHADRAAMVAIEHLYRLDEVRAEMARKNFPLPDIGIGLNTGSMSVGNMGSQERFTYTVMGDAVNLGARLEALTKEYGIKIMISEFTQKALSPNKFLLRDLDDIRVKGKTEPVRVYELLRPDYLPTQQAVLDLLGEFQSARDAYRLQDWAKAEAHLQACLLLNPSDGPAKKYMNRIEEFRQKSPGQDWDGVYTFTHK